MTRDDDSSDEKADLANSSKFLRYQEAVDKNSKVEIGMADLDKIIGSISLLAFSVSVLTDAIKNRVRVSEESEALLEIAADRVTNIASLMTDLSLEIMKRADHG